MKRGIKTSKMNEMQLTMRGSRFAKPPNRQLWRLNAKQLNYIVIWLWGREHCVMQPFVWEYQTLSLIAATLLRCSFFFFYSRKLHLDYNNDSCKHFMCSTSEPDSTIKTPRRCCLKTFIAFSVRPIQERKISWWTGDAIDRQLQRIHSFDRNGWNFHFTIHIWYVFALCTLNDDSSAEPFDTKLNRYFKIDFLAGTPLRWMMCDVCVFIGAGIQTVTDDHINVDMFGACEFGRVSTAWRRWYDLCFVFKIHEIITLFTNSGGAQRKIRTMEKKEWPLFN